MYDDRHRHQKWLKFFRLIDYAVPANKEIHMIVDNYATHKYRKVERWLSRHPRFHMHSTPTGFSWLNMAERYFRDLTTWMQRRLFPQVDCHSEARPMAVPNPSPFTGPSWRGVLGSEVPPSRCASPRFRPSPRALFADSEFILQKGSASVGRRES